MEQIWCVCYKVYTGKGIYNYLPSVRNPRFSTTETNPTSVIHYPIEAIPIAVTLSQRFILTFPFLPSFDLENIHLLKHVSIQK
jgi:hypothetical protein